jgi:hypothetical protein
VVEGFVEIADEVAPAAGLTPRWSGLGPTVTEGFVRIADEIA